jgi:AraC family transcriptional regulator
MSVKTIASSCALSPSQFSRAFTKRQGESVMAYVRGRRLECAMKRLIEDPATRLVDLAFDVGFDSQEAFTRAFARAFGEAPGRLQRAGAATRLRRRRRSRMAKPTILESIEQRGALRLAGLSKSFTPATTVEMGALWQRFVPLIGFPGRLGGGDIWGVAAPLCGRRQLRLPRRRTHRIRLRPAETVGNGHTAGAYLPRVQADVERRRSPPQTLVATDVIWSERVPASGHRIAAVPDFRRYPAQFAVKEGGWIDHFLPIEA